MKIIERNTVNNKKKNKQKKKTRRKGNKRCKLQRKKVK